VLDRPGLGIDVDDALVRRHRVAIAVREAAYT
jgi:L-alanine-DL-glutamate epimerase-like enolase superfamily enzyme